MVLRLLEAGGHFELPGPLWLEADAIFHDIRADHEWANDNLDFLIQTRVTLGWRVVQGLSIFAGLALNQTISDVRENAGFGLSFNEHRGGGLTYSMSPGCTLGLQLEPRVGAHNTFD